MMIMIPTTTLPGAVSAEPPKQDGMTADAADFFAAFFAPSLMPPTLPVTPEPAAQEEPSMGMANESEQGVGAFFPEMPETPLAGSGVSAELAAPLDLTLTKGEKELFDALPKPAEPIAPHPIKPPEYAIDHGTTPRATGPHDMMKPTRTVVCHLPGDISTVPREPGKDGVVTTLDPNGAYIPVDVLTLDGAEVVELEILPAADKQPRTDVVQTEVLLEVGAPVQMPIRHAFVDEIRAKSNGIANEKKEIEPVSSDESAGQVGRVPLLDTFTANVMPAAVKSEVLARSSGGGIEAEEFAPFVEKAEPERTEFPEGSMTDMASLDAKDLRPEPQNTNLSETKIRRVVLDQVSSKLGEMVIGQGPGDEKRSIKIRLTPAELGTVEITLVRTADGVLDAHIHTDNPSTHSALKETLAQLRDSLENSGNKVGNLDTSCSDFSGGSSSRRDQQRVAENPAYRTVFPDVAAAVDSRAGSSESRDRLVSLQA